jgi:rhodanese-related sulfurtransferase
MHAITPSEVRHKQQAGHITLIDVRGPDEYATLHAEGAQNIPLDRLRADTVAHLDRHQPVYVICKSGARSQLGIRVLHGLGFHQLYNVTGGTVAWAASGLPTRSVHALAR